VPWRLFARAFQRVFDENLAIFEYLVGQGATAAVTGQLLAEVGIVRDDGTALPEGTVTSALSRARERAARAPMSTQPVPAATGRDMPVNAVDRNAVQGPARRGIRARDIAQPQLHPPPIRIPPPRVAITAFGQRRKNRRPDLSCRQTPAAPRRFWET